MKQDPLSVFLRHNKSWGVPVSYAGNVLDPGFNATIGTQYNTDINPGQAEIRHNAQILKPIAPVAEAVATYFGQPEVALGINQAIGQAEGGVKGEVEGLAGQALGQGLGQAAGFLGRPIGQGLGAAAAPTADAVGQDLDAQLSQATTPGGIDPFAGSAASAAAGLTHAPPASQAAAAGNVGQAAGQVAGAVATPFASSALNNLLTPTPKVQASQNFGNKGGAPFGGGAGPGAGLGAVTSSSPDVYPWRKNGAAPQAQSAPGLQAAPQANQYAAGTPQGGA